MGRFWEPSDFFSYTILNVFHDRRYRHPARGSVPELDRCGFLFRERHCMDGCGPVDHQPGGPGEQERRQVLHPQRAVHDPAGHYRLHADQVSGKERRDPRAQRTPLCRALKGNRNGNRRHRPVLPGQEQTQNS